MSLANDKWEMKHSTFDPTNTDLVSIIASASHVSGAVGTNASEVIVTDPLTGGKKGQKLQRFDLIPNEFETALATHYGLGARKYEDRNWERGYKWSLSVGALRRHLAAWLSGERLDPETGSHHLIAVAWHACALFIFELRGLGTDDIRSGGRGTESSHVTQAN